MTHSWERFSSEYTQYIQYILPQMTPPHAKCCMSTTNKMNTDWLKQGNMMMRCCDMVWELLWEILRWNSVTGRYDEMWHCEKMLWWYVLRCCDETMFLPFHRLYKGHFNSAIWLLTWHCATAAIMSTALCADALNFNTW